MLQTLLLNLSWQPEPCDWPFKLIESSQTSLDFVTQPLSLMSRSLNVILPCRGNRHQLDRYDHIWGIYITKSGKRRRMDLIFVPPDCHSWVFAYTGWTGSKQYLRFMRTHAGEGATCLLEFEVGQYYCSYFLVELELLEGKNSQLLT